VPIQGQTALHRAVACGNEVWVELLNNEDIFALIEDREVSILHAEVSYSRVKSHIARWQGKQCSKMAPKQVSAIRQ